MRIDWPKMAKYFSVNSHRKFLSWHKVSRQAGKQASKWISPHRQVLFGKMFAIFYIYWSLALAYTCLIPWHFIKKVPVCLLTYSVVKHLCLWLRRIITTHHCKKISRGLGQGSIKTKNLLLLVSGPNTVIVVQISWGLFFVQKSIQTTNRMSEKLNMWIILPFLIKGTDFLKNT